MSDPSFCEFDMTLTSIKRRNQLLSLLDSVDGFQTLFDHFQEDSEDQREEQGDSGLREDPDVSQKFRDVESAAVEEEDGGSESFREFQKDWRVVLGTELRRSLHLSGIKVSLPMWQSHHLQENQLLK